jgi:hypothetical protein
MQYLNYTTTVNVITYYVFLIHYFALLTPQISSTLENHIIGGLLAKIFC